MQKLDRLQNIIADDGQISAATESESRDSVFGGSAPILTLVSQCKGQSGGRR